MVVLSGVAQSCKESNSGQLGSETNWDYQCVSNGDCGRGTCLCGMCTETCTGDATCGGGTCITRGSAAYAASCALYEDSPSAVCAEACKTARDCSRGMHCMDGACIREPESA